MSLLRPQADRGPADSHILSRFSTTYSSSYRPFEEKRNAAAFHCTPGTATASSLEFNAKPSGEASIQPLTSSQAGSCNRTPFSLGRSEVGNSSGRRTWEVREPITSQQSPFGSSATSGMSTLPVAEMHSTSGVNRSGGTSSLGNPSNRTYTSTYSTMVADATNPCPSIYAHDMCSNTKATSQPTQPGQRPTYCPVPPRTIPTVTPSSSASDQNACDSPDNRKVVIQAGIPLNYPMSTQFDLTQMFSQIARINDHLYLSSLSALTPERLRQHKITLLVSAMVDPPPATLRAAVVNCLHVPVEDAEGANLRAHFDRVADRILAESRRGGRALVHCMAGVSRSSSLILAYLMRHRNMSLADAYHHVKTIRPCIQPNPSFWNQLLEFEERIRGSRSVRLLPPPSYGGVPVGFGHKFANNSRSPFRSSYMDMFARNTGDLLPYRPLVRLNPMEATKPFAGCRQTLG